MIALLFWSSPAAGADSDRFAAHLAGFHRTLAAAHPQGFRTSACFRTDPTPWTPWHPPVFEDWYITSNFAGVDHLIDVVKHTDRADSSSSHQHLVQKTDMGMGAIFGLRLGQPQPGKTPHAWWFDATSASDVEARVRELDLPGRGVSFSLWIRALGLGPVKCCLQASVPLDNWAPYEMVHRPRTLLHTS